MKIGIIGDSIDRQYAGIHYYTKNLVRQLSLIDEDHEYYIFKSRKTGLPGRLNEVVVPIIRWIPGFQSIRLLVLFPYLARKYGLDVMVEPAHFGPFNLPDSIKRVTVIHDLTPIINTDWHTFNGWFLQKLFLPRIIRKADKIITNSEYTKSDVVRLMKKPAGDVEAIHLGVSEDFYPNKNLRILGNYGIYKPYFLYLGTLEPRKNLIRLIEAYGLFRLNNSDVVHQLILVGKKGWKIREIMKAKYMSAFQEDIILLGYAEREDLSCLLSSCEIFIYPSLYEGFGMPLLEAMACGARVIASNCTSLPEVGQEHADYFNPEDPEDMARVIEGVFYRKDDGREQRISYARGFTWERMAKGIKEVLEGLIRDEPQ